MSDDDEGFGYDGGDAATATLPPAADAAMLTGWVAALGRLDPAVDDTERVRRLRALEEVKAAACAEQARLAAALDASTRAHHATLGVWAAGHGRGVAAQVGLARRESPARGAQHLGLAKVLVGEMPHTLAALSCGWLSEWRATLLARETACLSREDRAHVDRALAGDRDRIEGLGDRALAAEATKLAYALDPQAFTARARKAQADRTVTCRPAPDTMAYLTALLPVKQAVAAYAALTRAAQTARAAGDQRGRGQVMADTLVERVTGQTRAGDVPVTVDVVITDRSLLAGDNEPAHLPGYGPAPAGLVRDWLTPTTPDDPDPDPAAALAQAAKAWIRRLYTHPSTGELVAMDSTRRLFPAGLRQFLFLRDQTCRTPWCDAPTRHADHIIAATAGGPTSAGNGQSLCEACNYAKQAPGWRTRPVPGPRHTVETTTPTGHTYHSTAPPQPGTPPPRGAPSRAEICFTDYILTA
jgi:hypothetical protein